MALRRLLGSLPGEEAGVVLSFAPRAATDAAAIALGTMNFGKRTAAAEAERIVHRALDLGVAVVDTANAYGDGESERIVGHALRGKRDRAVVATKVGFKRIGGKPEGLAPQRILVAIDESLRNLAVDRVDVYYLHVPDRATPLEDTLGAVAALLASGKIGAWGVSNYASWEIVEMFAICARTALPKPVVGQQIYNLLIRQLDIEYLRFAARYALHTTVYNPLAGGLLTGTHRDQAAIRPRSRFDGNKLYQGRYWSDPMRHAASAYEDLAKAHDLSAVGLAYAWLARATGVDSILVGPGSEAHLDDAARAVGVMLSPEVRREVDRLHVALLGTETTYAR